MGNKYHLLDMACSVAIGGHLPILYCLLLRMQAFCGTYQKTAIRLYSFDELSDLALVMVASYSSASAA